MKRVWPSLFISCLLTSLVSGTSSSCKSRVSYAGGKEGLVFENKTDGRRVVALPDGSHIDLGPNSTVSLSGTFGQTLRELDLDGEAVFDIVPDANKTFFIHTRLLHVEILGTRFRADAHRDMPGEEIDLFSGRLRVRKAYHSDTDSLPEELQSGEMIMINKDIDLMEKEKMDSGDRKRIGYNE